MRMAPALWMSAVHFYFLLAAGGELVWPGWVPAAEPSCFCEPEKTRANLKPMSESKTNR